MERLTTDLPAPDQLRGSILALGNFDGFHRGHQAVVAHAQALALAQARPLIIATFDPHPVRFFKPTTPPFRLTTLDQRETLFAAAGAQAMLVLRFDAALAGMSAADFVAELLVKRLGVAHVVTGEDFSFGQGRSGTVGVLAELGQRHGLATSSVAPVSDIGGVISSSRIRALLKAGDPQAAAALLTRPFTVQAVVEHGDKNGRKLGYPTANLDLGKYLRPRYGIYAVTGELPDGRVLKGAANLGIRPQFDPPKEWLEPHFFDFNEALYGQTIAVALHHFLRPEAKFDSLAALKQQMEHDCTQARALLEGK
jgi:riboflavin kinase / FMN adenylyltransferase